MDGENFSTQIEAHAVSERQFRVSLLTLGMKEYDFKKRGISPFSTFLSTTEK
jgi:hypothetical protein